MFIVIDFAIVFALTTLGNVISAYVIRLIDYLLHKNDTIRQKWLSSPKNSHFWTIRQTIKTIIKLSNCFCLVSYIYITIECDYCQWIKKRSLKGFYNIWQNVTIGRSVFDRPIFTHYPIRGPKRLFFNI